MKHFLIPTVRLFLFAAAIFAVTICSFSENANAQNDNPMGKMPADTAGIPLVSPVDSSMAGVSVFDLIKGENILLHQDAGLKSAFECYVKNNQKRVKNGYRIMVYISNAQSARGESESVCSQFKDTYPGLGVYMSYANPFFRVTVGDFRTKTDALKLYYEIVGRFPRAKIIRDKINWCQFD